MSDTSRGDLPTERDDPALTDDRPAGLASYDATTDLTDDDVIDISDNAGPELTTGVADIDTGSSGGHGTAARGWAPSAGSDGARSDLAAVRGDDTGTETPPQAIPDDEP